jgi:hypothetical protein
MNINVFKIIFPSFLCILVKICGVNPSSFSQHLEHSFRLPISFLGDKFSILFRYWYWWLCPIAPFNSRTASYQFSCSPSILLCLLSIIASRHAFPGSLYSSNTDPCSINTWKTFFGQNKFARFRISSDFFGLLLLLLLLRCCYCWHSLRC